MKHRFFDLIEVAKVQRLTDLFYAATGIPASVIDLDGTVITGSGWQEICTNFHRVNAETRERCIESDTVIANQIGAGQKYTVYGCKNGLIDAATPITIEGEHVANFFTGQFLFHPPDRDFFQEQARRFGFDEAAYMEAVAKIPVIDEARLQPFLEYFSEFAAMLGEMGLKHLKQIEAAAALRESEQRWATTLSSVGGAVIATDKDGGITFMNTVAEGLTGWSLSEAAAKPITEVFNIINERTREAVDNPVTKVLQKGMIVGLANHTVLVSKDGKEIPIDDSGSPIRDAAGNTMGVILVFRDITERKSVEERASHLASFPELNPNPVIEVDSSGEKTFCNPGTLRVLEGLGMDRADCHSFLPRDLKAIIEHWDREHESTLQREVSLNNRVFAETVHLVPQFKVARIYAHDVIERKEAEEKLLRAKEEWERTFASVPDMVAIIDNEHRILRVNEAMAQRLGHRAEECVGLRCFEAIHGTSEPPGFCPHAKSLKDGLQHIEEVHEERLGGDFLVSTTPLHDQEGRMIGTVHVAHDITERTAAEEARRESQRQMNKAQEIAHLGSWELDLVNNRLSWSDEVYRIFGLEPQEFGATYDAFLEAVHPDDRAAVDAAYSGSLREGKDTYEIEHRVIRRSSGEVRIVHEKCEHLRDDTGRIVKSIGMVHDITERKAAEERLREGEELYRNIVETATEGIWIGDTEARTTFVNKRMADMLGYAPEELTGRMAYDFMDEDARVLAESALERRLQGQRGSYEQKYVRKDGTILWALTSGAPLRDKDGHVVASLAILTDITERKAAEEALSRSEERYRSLFNGMTEGFALHEIICNEKDEPVDYRFLEINPAFERLTGLARKDVLGRLVTEVLPGIESYWIKTYGEVALTGRPAQFMNYAAPLQKHYEVFAYRPAPRQFAVLFMDVTERKRLEEETRRLLSAVVEEKDRLSALINSINDEVWFADTNKRFVLANPSALREFGFEAGNDIDVEKLATSLEVYRPDGTPRPVDEAPPLRALGGEVVRNQEEIIRTPATGEAPASPGQRGSREGWGWQNHRGGVGRARHHRSKACRRGP